MFQGFDKKALKSSPTGYFVKQKIYLVINQQTFINVCYTIDSNLGLYIWKLRKKKVHV